MTDYIPIQEFADRAGISRQAVTKNKQLAPYIRDTKPKTISTEALSLFDHKESNPIPEESNPIPEESPTIPEESNPIPEESNPIPDPLCASILATIEALKTQLAEKDRIIAEKDDQLRDLTKKVSDLAELSHNIAEKSVVALQQRNFLEAQSQLPPPEPEKKPFLSRFIKKKV